MGKYRVFASYYQDEQTMREHNSGDEALNLKRNSEVFTTDADSLEAALERFQESKEFEEFFEENGSAVFFYLDEKHNIHRV